MGDDRACGVEEGAWLWQPGLRRGNLLYYESGGNATIVLLLLDLT